MKVPSLQWGYLLEKFSDLLKKKIYLCIYIFLKVRFFPPLEAFLLKISDYLVHTGTGSTKNHNILLFFPKDSSLGNSNFRE